MPRIIFTFGMFLKDIQREFGASKSKVTIVGSLLAGFYLMAGPFVSALANRYGFRLVTILGSILGTVGFLASSFATDWSRPNTNKNPIALSDIQMALVRSQTTNGAAKRRMALVRSQTTNGAGAKPNDEWRWREAKRRMALIRSQTTNGASPKPNDEWRWREAKRRMALVRSQTTNGAGVKPNDEWWGEYACLTISSSEPLGIGFGLIYVPAVITTGFYFERWRAIATGIAVCGSGIGAFVLAPFAVHLIEWYGWRGALIIQAGLVLNCAIFGTLFRPLEPVRVVTTREVSMKNNHSESKLSLLKRIKQERDEHRRNRGSLASVDSDKYEKSSIRVTNNNAYTTAAEALARSVGSLPGSRFASTHSLGMSNHHGVETGEEHLKAVYEMERGEDDTMTALVHHQSQSVIRRGSKRLRTASESSSRSRKGLELSGTKPFYRDDIFFGASLTRLPQYTSQSSISYHMSVTRLPTKQDVKEQDGENSRICTEALTRTLGTMLDFSLFKSPTFLILAVSGFITMMGFYVPFIYLTVRKQSRDLPVTLRNILAVLRNILATLIRVMTLDRAELSGMERDLAMFLVSCIGITNTIGRVMCGIVSSIPGMNALFINNTALTLGGAATILSGVSMSVTYQYAYAVIFGLSIACFASLRSIIIVDLMGLDNLTNAFGLLLLFQGMSAAIGSPIAGAFMDATGSYDASFYLSGTLILVSAILCYPLNRVNRWEKRRAAELGAGL
uniref:(California timema) hypothetical protein n=1 Tax=Timema californicum TaxID=61474 RepID=A0A7R9P3U2_TIMCA|nr:unnamed protein product [Timema californicum]